MTHLLLNAFALTKLFKDVEFFLNIYYDYLFVGEFGTLSLPLIKLAARIPFLPFFINLITFWDKL